MRRLPIYVAAIIVLTLLVACNQPAQPTQVPTGSAPTSSPTPAQTSSSNLTLNPIETSMPVYGGKLERGYWIPRSFDGHQKVAYGPTATLPVFNQLVMFDINYKETTAETIIGDLAKSWEINENGTEITFDLHQGVKWHDGVPFTADDVLYSLEKMTDVTRSAISDWFPAYQSSEKTDDYTVKVHLKYPSAGFMLALAQGESQIQAGHLANTDDQSAAFMVGTGPFILTDYLPQIYLKFKRNPGYWKRDSYGNQLPYLDEVYYHHLAWARTTEMMVGRRLDIMDTVTGASTLDTFELLKNGAPELLWQRRDRYSGSVIFLNTSRKPLSDIRVRRAMALLIKEDELILGYAGDAMFGITGSGILHPAFGLRQEEIAGLLGWDKLWGERVAEAQRLMTEAGYSDGFKLNMMTAEGGTRSNPGAALVYAETLRQYLKIDAELSTGLGSIELQRRLDEGIYDTYTRTTELSDPLQLKIYFGTGGYSNHSKYSNTELDTILGGLDQILDPDARREAIWSVERTLLVDVVALPTGCFVPSFMPYYPQVKNLRWNYISYSNINRMEDVWLDESLRVK
ncbi:MAG: ABC transporter substrate-binding protein [Dehalococcoidales bacterium]|nr:ABC transporter substrate-binding protein [Dehalococcoidales bacterium]